MTEKSFNVEKEEEIEAEAKAESNKRRSLETITVSTANVTRTGSPNEAHHRDKSNEDVEESHEECKYLCLSLFCKKTGVYICLSPPFLE